ncbi:hypothetical protein FBY14_104215 [Azospirillum brasilense]|nr:hypothetical protein FBY14_104215 [Azospirillum brasilense]
MTDPLTVAYVALAVFVSVLIGIGVLGVLVWRRITQHLTSVRLWQMDNGAAIQTRLNRQWFEEVRLDFLKEVERETVGIPVFSRVSTDLPPEKLQ